MSSRSVDEKDCCICKLQEAHKLCEGHHKESAELTVEWLKLKALTDIAESLKQINIALGHINNNLAVEESSIDNFGDLI